MELVIRRKHSLFTAQNQAGWFKCPEIQDDLPVNDGYRVAESFTAQVDWCGGGELRSYGKYD